jgi:hypothetical protein
VVEWRAFSKHYNMGYTCVRMRGDIMGRFRYFGEVVRNQKRLQAEWRITRG